MQEITGNPDFQYTLLCNKICGAAHYNMKMDIIVESEEDYNKWLSEQKQFLEVEGKATLDQSENEDKADSEELAQVKKDTILK